MWTKIEFGKKVNFARKLPQWFWLRSILKSALCQHKSKNGKRKRRIYRNCSDLDRTFYSRKINRRHDAKWHIVQVKRKRNARRYCGLAVLLCAMHSLLPSHHNRPTNETQHNTTHPAKRFISILCVVLRNNSKRDGNHFLGLQGMEKTAENGEKTKALFNGEAFLAGWHGACCFT